jgi:nucleotide-binding universal stress UspA family protein
MDYHPLTSRTFNPAPVAALLRDWSAAGEPFASAQPKQKWLVPVDGTPSSLSAVEHVIAHADSARTHVHLVNVQPPIMTGDVSVLASEKLVADLRHAAGAEALRDAKRLLSRHSFQHTCEVVFGGPAEAIVRSAAERGCSKIVMCSRRTSLIAHIAGRSVSGRVIRLAHVPVTVVKPDAPRASLAASERWIA